MGEAGRKGLKYLFSAAFEKNLIPPVGDFELL
jgi:hypothetical protein